MSEKIKVLHFGLGVNRGGIETYLYKLSSGINKDRFSFSFIDLNKKDPCFYHELNDLGFTFYKITPRRGSALKNRHELENLFSQYAFDIFHCHINTLSYITPILIAIKHNVKVIVHSRNAGTGGAFLTRLMHMLNQYRLPKDKVTCIAVSHLAGQWLFGQCDDFKVFNNGVDLERFRFLPDARVAVRQAMKIADDDIVLGNVGAFLPAKNQPFVIEVFARLLEKQPNARLLLVGEGYLKTAAEDRAKALGVAQKVTFLGRRTDMPALLSAMDLLLFPSFYEGFPNAVLEAQATGLPCLLSTNVTHEVLVLENCQRLPLTKTADAWADYALALIAQPVDRLWAFQMLEQAGFSVRDEITRMENLYTSLLNQ
jgi:glycosyltransferase involved in cell wall biosynthesis